MGVKLQSTLGGSVELTAPSTTGTYQLTIPAITAKVLTDSSFIQIGNYGGTFQGMTVANNADSSLSETVSFIDAKNNLNITDSNIFFGHQTDGGSYLSFATTPIGSRSSDRRVERVRIDSSGRLITPYVPSFRVSMTTNTAQTGTVIFNNTYHNNGSYYNSSNGRFTAPVTGYYFLSATGGLNVGHGFDIKLNGTSILVRSETSSTSTYVWNTCSTVVYLNANDYVNVVIFSGSVNFEPGLGGFCGYLIG